MGQNEFSSCCPESLLEATDASAEERGMTTCKMSCHWKKLLEDENLGKLWLMKL